MAEFDRLEVQHFFEVYKDLEPGKSVEGATWEGRQAAEREVKASYKRFEEEGHGIASGPSFLDQAQPADE
jgi:inorganic pyrophosphatase